MLSNDYDALGRRTTLTLPDASTVSYSYNAGFLHSVQRKGWKHTYAERDLDGAITRSTLPAKLGDLYVKRDALARCTALLSPFFLEEQTYDSVGNLSSLHLLDPLGELHSSFAYDDLHQLVAENENSYSFDSLYNRRRTNNVSHAINDLCQIADAGYHYDANGNMLSNGECLFEYDTQDRLIKVTRGELTLLYTYDPFHRRLSKAVYQNQQLLQKSYFLWDGNNEIGSFDEELSPQELRILGEGLGAELGAALFLELNGKSYVPLHDHRGSLIILLDLETQKPIETYRYTAFGEETTQGTLSPWRFSSKRLDTETGFIYFGRRYYSPALGRWITPDPQGFTDGPNLYAYVLNNPLSHFDLYGLRVERNRNIFLDGWLYFTRERIPRSKACDHRFFGFEKTYANKSKYIAVPRPEAALIGAGLGFINGLGNTEKDARGTIDYFDKDLNLGQMDLVYNATHGILADLIECIYNLCRGKMTPPAFKLIEGWDNFFQNANPNAVYVQICHSQGAIHVRNALRHYSKELRKRIIVLAIAPGAYIHQSLCLSVTHFVSKRDIVPRLDLAGRKSCADTIVYLDPHKDAKWFDHGIKSPTYAEPLQDAWLKIQKKYGENH
jgi:RHS repeat-associated protein